MSPRRRILMARLKAFARRIAHDDRGVTTEQVIWIAFLAATALAVTAYFGPQILAAAHSVKFK
ncbi:hypothetical protein [Streptomyces sp. ODS28]|uniref:hypothetical protein n=1 Tax=Streptomyces sp. ODS28 TaxID=3136688 RepID=UPI0031E7C74F